MLDRLQEIFNQLLKCKITESASTYFLSDTIGNPRSTACFLLVGGRIISLQLLKEEIKKLMLRDVELSAQLIACCEKDNLSFQTELK